MQAARPMNLRMTRTTSCTHHDLTGTACASVPMHLYLYAPCTIMYLEHAYCIRVWACARTLLSVGMPARGPETWASSAQLQWNFV